MRILVTGATGYVGSRLVTTLLADRHEAARDTGVRRIVYLGGFVPGPLAGALRTGLGMLITLTAKGCPA